MLIECILFWQKKSVYYIWQFDYLATICIWNGESNYKNYKYNFGNLLLVIKWVIGYKIYFKEIRVEKYYET